MNEEIKVWKVLRAKTRKSAICSSEKYSLSYPVNERVTPVVGKIFCFDTIENAKNFKEKNDIFGDLSIHEAVATNPQSIVKIACLYSSVGFVVDEAINLLWNNGYIATMEPPPGTLVCDSLKCLE